MTKKNKIGLLSFLLLLTISIAKGQLTGQIFSGTIRTGSNANAIVISIKPNVSFTGKFTNLQFTIQLPNTIFPLPNATIRNNFLSSYLSTSNYIYTITNEEGFYNFLFNINSSSTPDYNFISGNSIDVLEIEFNSAALGIVAYSRLGHLNNGGALNGQMSFYTEISGNDNTDYVNMFYGTGASNHGSYDGYSYVPVQNIIVPISDIELTVLKNENLAEINWKVINQKDNVIKYEIEKSNNGTQFDYLESRTPSSNHIYHHTDNLNSQSEGYVFYRIKEIYADNQVKYSEIKSLLLSKLTYTTIYPIPCHELLTIVTQAEFDFNTYAKIFDESGKLLITKSTPIHKGKNMISIDVSHLPKGNYFLEIPNALTIKKFIKL